MAIIPVLEVTYTVIANTKTTSITMKNSPPGSELILILGAIAFILLLK